MTATPGAAAELSLIILTHNTLELTRECIRSILAPGEATPSVEVIVVDNASTDGTAEALEAEFPGLRVIRNASNFGFSGGNNAGLAAARGRYRMLLNSDTLVQRGALRELVAFMEAHPEAGACGPMLLNEDGTLQPSGRDLPSLWSLFVGMTKLYRLWKQDFYQQVGRDYSQTARVGEVSGAALLVRDAAYLRVGGLDPNLFAYYEDVDWCKRIGEAGFAIYYVPAARVVHRWRGTSRAVSRLAYRAGQDSQRYYFAKHHGPAAHAAVQALLAGKEAVLWAIAAWRDDADSRAWHREMFGNAYRPLAGPQVAR